MQQEPRSERAQLHSRIEQIKSLLSQTIDPQQREQLVNELADIALLLAEMDKDSG